MSIHRTKSLNNISERKIEEKRFIIENNDDSLEIKAIKLNLINRYYESNIPLEYWNLEMEKHFSGDPNLLQFYVGYTTDIKASYQEGKGHCFAGNYGLGKTLTGCNILKKCLKKGYSCLYTNLSDIVSVLTGGPYEDRFYAKKELTSIDFLFIDEWDNRFMSNENVSDLYARILETIIRTRAQNNMPTLFATNSPNIVEAFTGDLKNSLSSLKNGYIVEVPVFGEDFRGKK